jgi:hypothetical protein
MAGRVKPRTPLVMRLSRKWGPVFGAPVGSLMAITWIESMHDPVKINMARADKGGAWGLGQQMADEAEYKLGVIWRQYKRRHPELKHIINRYDGTAQSLLDPELNMVLTAWQLGLLTDKLGDFATVAAAYQQGLGAVRSRLDAGKPAVSPRHQEGLLYVERAVAAQDQFAPLILASMQ